MSKLPPQSDQMRVTGSGRRKVALPPGRSQLDWLRNSRAIRRRHPQTISLTDLKKHNTKHDAWLAVMGNVYNITPYLEYHPGGIPIIMAGAGKDATKLFNKYHPWVNTDFMLSTCFMGVLDPSHIPSDESESDTDTDTDDDESEDNSPQTNSHQTSQPSSSTSATQKPLSASTPTSNNSQSSNQPSSDQTTLEQRLQDFNFAEIEE